MSVMILSIVCRHLLEVENGKWKRSNILTAFETIWRCRVHYVNRGGKECILTVFETIWNCRVDYVNRDGKECTLTVFETIWNCREKMKTRMVNGAFWWYLKQYGIAEKNENKTDKWCILTSFETILMSHAWWPLTLTATLQQYAQCKCNS